MDQTTSETTNPNMVERDPQKPEPARAELVQRWQGRITTARTFWKPIFDRMLEDQAFVAGKQWPGSKSQTADSAEENQYVANITLRHVQQATAALYGKDPKVVTRRKKRLLSAIWDGSAQPVMEAMQTLQMGMLDPMAMQLLQEVIRVRNQEKMEQRIGDTLQLVYEHSISEQAIPFKQGMKEVVRRALTTGVGYWKIGFQRAMQLRPEVEQQIADISEQLATIEHISADIADGETTMDDADAEKLRLTIKALQENSPPLIREGMTVDYPDSTALIPDPKCKSLKGFVGCDWVAEEFLLSAERIEDIYKIDLCGTSAATYQRQDALSGLIKAQLSGSSNNEDREFYRVYQIYSRPEGLVYTICDGFDDFLEEPHAPDFWIERFWPWFTYTKNDVYHSGSVFPPSDVRLMRDQQQEINRARQGLREHRQANRPKIAVPAGVLNAEDREKLQTHPANAVIELNALQPGQNIGDVLQPVKNPAIDPALYDVNQPFEDILRTVGTQEADLGGTSNATATESSIAQSARMTASGSAVDDLDEALTDFARAAGQLLLSEMSKDSVVEIVGPGAVWPSLNRDQLAKEIMLEIEAGSTGRPNKAAEIQNFQQLAPIMMQMPNLNPIFMLKEAVRRMDDRLDVDEAILEGMPSMAALNRMQPSAAGPEGDPNQQGPQGDKGQTNTKPSQVNAAPRQAPTPDMNHMAAGASPMS